MLDNVNKNYRPEFGSTTANFGMTTQQGGNQAHPAMQAEINKERIKDAANDNYIANRVNAFSEVDPTLQMGVALPVWLVMNQAMDRYLKACGGEYSKSIPGRIGNFGDKITDFLTNNPVAKGINKVLNKGQRFAKRNIYDNSALLRAFDRTPSQPELTLVKHQFAGDLGMIANDITNPCDAFLESVKSAKDLDCLGASKADIQRVEGLLKKAATAEEKRLILQAEEFRLLSPDKSSKAIRAFKYNANEKVKAKILKDLKIKAMGFKDAAEYELLKSDPIKYHEKLIEVFKKANKKMFSRVSWSDKNIMTKLNGEIFGRKVSFSQMANLIQASKGMSNTMHRSKLGRGLAKLSNMIMEGSTSRMAGGKIMALMQAYFLAEAIIMANKQETTGDKFKSLAERMTELIGFFVFMPPSIKLMHKIGGLQYSGMTPEQIANYRQAVKEFNEKVMNCAFANKKEYKAARKVLRSQFRPKTKNPFVWLARKCADIITVGLEQVRPYTRFKQKQVNLCITEILKSPLQYIKNIGPRLKDFACNSKYWLKQMAGYPVRFILPMMVFVTFFNKLAVKGCHAIFGKPKYSILDKEKIEEEQKKQEQMAAAAKINQATQNQINRTSVASTQTQTNTAAAAGTTNLLNKYKNPQPKSAQISSQGSLLNKLKPNKTEDKAAAKNESQTAKNEETKQQEEPKKARYIPSPEGVKIVQKDNSEVDAALQRADAAEKKALEVLAGKMSV